jgi:hypothetical protein
MELDGRKLATSFTTTEPSSVLTTDVTRKVYEFKLVAPKKDCGLTSTGLTHNPLVRYTECATVESPLFLGLDVLTKLRLYFALKENMLYFTGADDGEVGRR